jgi:hypothetical protein
MPRRQGASRSAFVWLGTTRDPEQLVMFCIVTLFIRVAGIPPTRTVFAPVRWREGPMTVPDATPPAIPALLPFVSGTTVRRLRWARSLRRPE